MDRYICTRLQEALENLESGVQLSQPVYIRKALLEFAALKNIVAKNSETALLLTQSIIRGCTAMCLLDPINAISHLRVALKCDPNHPAVLNNLGYMYHTQYSDWDKSVQYYTACLTADPTYVTGYLGLIDVYRVLRHTTLELEYCRRGVGYCPESPQLWNALGLALVNTDRSEAQNAFDMCLSLKTGSVTRCKALANLGHLAGIAGDIETALARYMDAIETDADQPTAYQNILLNLHYFSTPDLKTSNALRRVLKYFQVDVSTTGTPSNVTQIDEVIRDVHDRVATKLYPRHAPPPQVHAGHRDLTRKLTIGYVASDVFDHAVSRFTACLFKFSNQTAFDTYVYSNCVYDADAVSTIRCTGYRCIQGVPAVQVVTQIQRDRVDILIDLSGHTSGNRLDAFALHPVPVMLSYCGYPSVTWIKGLRRISDSYTEKFNPNIHDDIVFLPCLFLSFTPEPLSKEWLDAHVKVPRSIAVDTPVTFGCFAKLQKINQHVIDAWIEILSQVPNSKLILKARAFDDPSVETIWKNKFGPELLSRITLLRHTTTPVKHLESFKLIDIHLDTFPYSGTTITCESLYMNVPVVTLAPVSIRSVGHVARVSGSILSEMGFAKQLVANTHAQYVKKAVALVERLPTLPSVREAFGNVVLASSPAGQDFVRAFEDLVTDEFLKA
ncbi:hypothetical protein HDU81_008594 [Chytriomyces hyalinus]|nr:hypothetical protein HDU81_008594 [Chytriomyces hyalinus]